jgi:multidrug resistance efflux pump
MIRFILLSSIAILIVACSGKQEPAAAPSTTTPMRVREIVGIGRVEPATRVVALATTAGGIVREVVARDGQRVHAGDVLLRLDDAAEVLALSVAEQKVATQQAQLAAEEAAITEAIVKRENKQRERATSEVLVGTGAETRQQLDAVSTEEKALAATIARATASAAAARATVAELRVAVQQAVHDKDLRTMRAPTDGTVLEIPVSVGAALPLYATYAQFAPASSTVVRCEVDELFAAQLRIGLPVSVRAIGSTAALASGVVQSVSPFLKRKSIFSEKVGDQEDRRVREVVVSIADPGALLINAKVECVITL